MRVQRHKTDSVRFDKRRGTWNFLWYDGRTRRSKRIGTKQQFATKAAAWKAVERLEILQPQEQDGDTVRSVIARYEAGRMPTRHSTARVYRSFLKMMRHADIRTTFNIYGDVVTDEMTTAGARVAKLAFEGIGAQTECNES